MDARAHLGKEAEEVVTQKLIKDGFSILERNYRKRGGEIDIIANKPNLMIFVEVKMRQQNYFDLGNVITPSKQRKIIATAKYYMMRLSNAEQSYRFDVALLQGTPQGLALTYIPNAFNEGNYSW